MNLYYKILFISKIVRKFYERSGRIYFTFSFARSPFSAKNYLQTFKSNLYYAYVDDFTIYYLTTVGGNGNEGHCTLSQSMPIALRSCQSEVLWKPGKAQCSHVRICTIEVEFRTPSHCSFFCHASYF